MLYFLPTRFSLIYTSTAVQTTASQRRSIHPIPHRDHRPDPSTLIPLSACCVHGWQTCYTVPEYSCQPFSPTITSIVTHQHFLGVADAPRQIAHIAVSLHHLGRKLNAEPVSSQPSVHGHRVGPRTTYMFCTANTTLFANRPSRSTSPPNDSSTASGAISGSRSKQFRITGKSACSTAR
jgi:hypothetical protein